ncbi:hypothetical protein PV516_18755 [Streptomyces scabiei]|uniref:hypothetical protein n=1 Tax=Streptomyces scabiei TaxID=1930 RepID=UPI0029B8BF58|nr:hypothetical protein [Streptomyces scabiei]MDX3165827.1 hypothetical protein [Streptomyces scabiei]
MSTPREPTRDEALDQLISAALLQLERDWLLLITAQETVLRALATARRRGARPGAVPPSVRTALSAFTTATARFDTDAGALVERWAAVDLPRAYRLGAEDALDAAVLATGARRPGFAWTSTHQGALSELTAACYSVLIRRITDVVRRAQAFARAATTAARALAPSATADLAAQHPLDTVTYGQGARHPASAWARAALSAQSVTVANTGALTAATTDLEARWVQVTDGPECGWTSHPELDRAHDSLRSAEEAAIYPIAHPGCLRRFIPRPDLTHDPAIEEGQPV